MGKFGIRLLESGWKIRNPALESGWKIGNLDFGILWENWNSGFGIRLENPADGSTQGRRWHPAATTPPPPNRLIFRPRASHNGIPLKNARSARDVHPVPARPGSKGPTVAPRADGGTQQQRSPYARLESNLRIRGIRSLDSNLRPITGFPLKTRDGRN